MFRSSEGVQTRQPKLDGTGEPYVFKNCRCYSDYQKTVE